ncbi:hypothetical protein [Polyangium jinanense]|uniref:Uncharacterized protein n=1 Tax=Polyangium jinanense TaxID=2829994 RepID=A0A9X3X5S7_9BACT|nr:hypothetical protein [Polyangium jinanense]MDC3954088.1 hypothetical protein [Polyangium jinanense]MDC3981956.1 hypothetical protein [Polyangium jinanense]
MGRSGRFPRSTWPTWLLSLALLGCQRELDMAKHYDDRNAATTIRYIGVREATRQYPDYGVIQSTILTGDVGSGAKKEGRAP